MTHSATNIVALKNSNRCLILNALRTAPKSRAELSRLTGLAKSSVTTLTNQMIEEGLLLECGPAEKTSGVGRTAILLDINPAYGFAIGLHLHRKRITVTGVDLKGGPLFSFSERAGAFASADALLSYLDHMLPAELQQTGLDPDRLIGFGIASPGPLDCQRGIILEPPNFSLLNHLPITEHIEKTYGCPAVLENDAVTLALFEQHTVRPLDGNCLFVTVSDGIGGALLQNGVVYRGSHGIAGELGHISVDPLGEQCPCGNRGCLEQYATLSALQKRFGFSHYADMIDGALAGEPRHQAAFSFLVDTLGAAFVGAVNLFDLDRIVLFGEYAYRADRLAAALEEYIAQHSVVCKVHPVSVLPAGLEATHAPAAAAIPAINRFFEESMIG